MRSAIAAAAMLVAASVLAGAATSASGRLRAENSARSPSTTAARLRPRTGCSKSLRRAAMAVALGASSVRPSCAGAALMASDIHANASRRFPRNLPATLTVFAHGTNKAGDPRARYRCQVSNRFIRTGNGRFRRTTALCVNVGGDNFTYAFDMRVSSA